MAKPIGNVFKGVGQLFGVGGGGGPSAPDVPPPPPITPREVIRADAQDAVSKRNMEIRRQSPDKTRGRVSKTEAVTKRKSLLAARKAEAEDDA